MRPTVSVAAPLARTDAAALAFAAEGANVGAEVRTVTSGARAVAVTPAGKTIAVADAATVEAVVTAPDRSVNAAAGLLILTAKRTIGGNQICGMAKRMECC